MASWQASNMCLSYVCRRTQRHRKSCNTCREAACWSEVNGHLLMIIHLVEFDRDREVNSGDLERVSAAYVGCVGFGHLPPISPACLH